MIDIEGLIHYIVSSITDDPDHVQINLINKKYVHAYKVSVPRDDMRKIIGKNGRIAKAIRTITKAAGVRNGQNVSLDIV